VHTNIACNKLFTVSAHSPFTCCFAVQLVQQAPRLLHAFVQYWFFTSYKKSSHICLAYAHRTFTANRLLEHDLKNVFNQLGLARAVVNVNQSDDMMLYLDDQNHLVMPSVTACDAPWPVMLHACELKNMQINKNEAWMEHSACQLALLKHVLISVND